MVVHPRGLTDTHGLDLSWRREVDNEPGVYVYFVTDSAKLYN